MTGYPILSWIVVSAHVTTIVERFLAPLSMARHVVAAVTRKHGGTAYFIQIVRYSHGFFLHQQLTFVPPLALAAMTWKAKGDR
jgi:hypothetical protein